MQTFTAFFGGAFFGGEFFSVTPNVGGGYIKKYPSQTSTTLLLSRRALGLDMDFEGLMNRWGRPKKKE